MLVCLRSLRRLEGVSTTHGLRQHRALGGLAQHFIRDTSTAWSYESAAKVPGIDPTTLSASDKVASGILAGLLLPSPRISQVFLYNARGSDLYEQIVQQEEYYLPRAEVALQQAHIASIAAHQSASALVAPVASQVVIELGAGAGHKTMPLLDHLAREATLTTYVPIDISSSALDENSQFFADHFEGRPEIQIRPHVGGHEECMLRAASIPGRRIYLFMGSSLGNFDDEEILELFDLVSKLMLSGDRFLLGLDRAHGAAKAEKKILAAYNDAAGITAEFTLNALLHVNELAGLNFSVHGWRHVAEYDRASSTIQTYVEAVGPQTVLDAQGRTVRSFKSGERIFMEQSRKFNTAGILHLSEAAGLALTRQWMSDDYMIVELRKDLFKQWLARSKWIFKDLVGDEGLLRRPIALRNPYAFYLGHCAAFADIKVLQMPGADAESNRRHFERGIDPDVDDQTSCHSHSALPTAWPSVAQQHAYEERVCAQLKEHWLGCGLGAHSALGLMVLEHTMMHHETLLYMVAQDQRHKALPAQDPRPAQHANQPRKKYLLAQPAPLPQIATVHVAGGPCSLGASKAEVAELGFVWDNEMATEVREVPGFAVRSHAVTNSEFRAFVEDGGYFKGALWPTPEAGKWAQDVQQGKPLHWERSDRAAGGWTVHVPIRKPASMNEAAHWPVHVTLAEAQAYCTWIGGGARVMREEEYHRIFWNASETQGKGHSGGPGSPRACFRGSAIRGNNDFKHLAPTPVGALDDAPSAILPLFDLVGNGWEWTSSAFAPLSGFVPMPVYPEYSQDFFDGKHFVCLGASPFTSLQLLRPSFRNFFQARYPYGINKFRLAWTAP
ncbi:unnamed protein product [Polarella glacialis]|uniref:L-histidine N(alpha)-methyltransferase n=1 Tax=Polarella glacialis TaxID=89957 RepID=A0A813KLS7_POLGL|nr:unnamed protein product [Polarella glacialis]